MSQPVQLEFADTSLFIGLTTLPVEGDNSSFYKNNIQKNFDTYKKKVKEFDINTQDKSVAEEFDKLYTPNAYYLFGEFDLAVISLIDDFSFATKTFRPSGEQTFKYQVNTGLLPVMYNPKGKKFDPVDYYMETLFPEGKRMPVIGISSIKLNSTLIVGNGKDFTEAICRYLKAYLADFIDALKLKYDKLEYEFLIVQSLGWNEITLVSFSNAFEVIQDAISHIRNTNWKDIKGYLNEQQLPVTLREEETLLYKWITGKLPDKKRDRLVPRPASVSKKRALKHVDACHPFIATNTQLGFHLEYDHNKEHNNGFLSILDDRMRLDGKTEAKNFLVSWNVKAGHDTSFLQNAGKHFGFAANNTIREIAGKNSFTYPAYPLSFREYFEKIHCFLSNNKNNNVREVASHIYKLETAVVSDTNTSDYIEKVRNGGRNGEMKDHYEIYSQLEGLCFSYGDQIKILDERLRNLNISKILKGQVINMYHNFNEAIKDQLIFNNFIDLKAPLEQFYETIEKMAVKDDENTFDALLENEPDLKTESGFGDAVSPTHNLDESRIGDSFEPYKSHRLTTEIKDFVEAWDIAFWNRYFHSYYFTEVSDFNLEHHGGIEMILSAYDSMYKIISQAIYGGKFHQFVRVTIEPNITSTSYSNQLNFIHLFLPSLYATTVVHEAANHYLFKLGEDLEIEKELHEFIDRLSGGVLNDTNKYYHLLDNLRSSYDYSSLTEKEMIEEQVGANLFRYLVTDYITYKLQYEDINNEQAGIDKFIGFHLGCIAQQTELYRYDQKLKYWEFDEMNFKGYMFRLIFMLKVFGVDFKVKSFAPFSVFQSLYNNSIAEIARNADRLIIHLNEFIKEIKPLLENKLKAIHKNSSPEFKKIIQLNREFLDSFYLSFKLDSGDSEQGYKANVLIRGTVPEPGAMETNIIGLNKEKKFMYADVLLDPKGGIFCLTIGNRKRLHRLNCDYLNNLWDLAQKWRLTLYK